MKKTAAIVVSYNPNIDVLTSLLMSLAPQVDSLILVDNGGGEAVANDPRVSQLLAHYLLLDKNYGLGYALNKGFSIASAGGAEFVYTFDQDSDPAFDLLPKLLSAFALLKNQDKDCVAVGPVFYDMREIDKVFFPFYREIQGRIQSFRKGACADLYVETDALITSGMLVDIKAWQSGIQYDEGLFVDYTDTEWCFRVRAAGKKLYGCLNIEMGHSPSDSPPARIFGLSFFRYSPLRRFYYFRNTVMFCRKPYVSPAWRQRLYLGIMIRFFVNLIIDTNKLQALNMMIKGISRGFRNKSGKYVP